MSAKRFPAIISYDVSCNRARKRIARLLHAWKIDGQYSIAECFISYPEANELVLQLTEHLNEKTDSLLVGWLQHPVNTKLAGQANCGFRQGIVQCIR